MDIRNNAHRHVLERTEILMASLAEDDDSYVSVPANRMFYVKTRYVYVGKGAPLPFDLDDE